MKYFSEVISSRNNPTVKWASSLKEKKGRLAEGAFIVEGEKLSFEAIGAGLPVIKVFVLEDRCDITQKLKDLERLGNAPSCEVFILKREAFEKISTENAPQGIISVIKHLDFFKYSDIIYKEDFSFDALGKAIILDSVRDPGNLGAVIRSSVAFGIEHIILSADCADVYNPKTIRGAMGSLFRTKITVVSDLAGAIRSLRENGRRVYAAELRPGAVNLADIKLLASDVFVIGNEGHGIAPSNSQACDKSVYIPIAEATESLNASVAASIFIWEQSKVF